MNQEIIMKHQILNKQQRTFISDSFHRDKFPIIDGIKPIAWLFNNNEMKLLASAKTREKTLGIVLFINPNNGLWKVESFEVNISKILHN